MTTVLLLHHAQGLTPGVVAFADALREAGHTVHTPDVYDGRTFDDLDSGIAYAGEVGFDAVMQRGVRAAEGLPAKTVYVGLSLGVMAAQQLAQTRPGCAGAVFVGSCLPVSEFGGWPDGVPVQVHGKDADPIFVDEGDLDAARVLVASVEDAELFLYPGDEHLFLDSSLPDYDAAATAELTARVLSFLASP
ncbi:dienelactone hydrolase family protein [Cellulomonas sp. URHE0023]|uniref:dienelactone hydrolase family protein n=1 Tax=Cellulomonas sp. URHE0023 TaxID=1380354 RepID=UPI000483D323|nr:dienelactone hydrolase family protein [Cellulomonas sp. URHE0023]